MDPAVGIHAIPCTRRDVADISASAVPVSQPKRRDAVPAGSLGLVNESVHAAVRVARSAAGIPLSTVADTGGVSVDEVRAGLLAAAGRRGRCGTAATDAARRWPPSGLWHRCAAPSAVRALSEDLIWTQDIPSKMAAWAASSKATGPGPDMPGRLDRHGPIPPAALHRLAASTVADDRRAAATACSQPSQPFLLELLATDTDRWVRYYAARNDTCPPRTLVRLAESDTDFQVLAAVALHAALPARALQRLAGGGTDQRRAAAFATRNIGLLQRLADDSESVVRQAVAANPACSAELCEQLAEDPDMINELLDNSATPASVLETVVAVKDHREYAASHPNCSPALLEQLASDSDEHVRCTAAYHRSCPPGTLSQMLHDPAETVRVSAASNKRCPPEGVRHAAEHRSAAMRAAAARNPRCPPDVLRVLASDQATSVRCAVTANPNAAASMLVAAAFRCGDATEGAGRGLRDLFTDRPQS